MFLIIVSVWWIILNRIFDTSYDHDKNFDKCKRAGSNHQAKYIHCIRHCRIVNLYIVSSCSYDERKYCVKVYLKKKEVKIITFLNILSVRSSHWNGNNCEFASETLENPLNLELKQDDSSPTFTDPHYIFVLLIYSR